MNKFWDWFAEVHYQATLWWGLGLAICLFDGVKTFLETGLIGSAIFSFAKVVFLMFIIAPIIIGTFAYFFKKW